MLPKTAWFTDDRAHAAKRQLLSLHECNASCLGNPLPQTSFPTLALLFAIRCIAA